MARAAVAGRGRRAPVARAGHRHRYGGGLNKLGILGAACIVPPSSGPRVRLSRTCWDGPGGWPPPGISPRGRAAAHAMADPRRQPALRDKRPSAGASAETAPRSARAGAGAWSGPVFDPAQYADSCGAGRCGAVSAAVIASAALGRIAPSEQARTRTSNKTRMSSPDRSEPAATGRSLWRGRRGGQAR